MTEPTNPVVSVIVRRFRRERRKEIENLVKKIQREVSRQPGFIELQNNLSYKRDFFELVTVFSFDTRENMQKWDNSSTRKGFVKELDSASLDSATYAKFEGLAQLTSPNSRISKLETVVILIIWILILGRILEFFADFVLPASLSPILRHALTVSIIVLLISYVLLPWSSIALTRLKTRVAKIAKRD